MKLSQDSIALLDSLVQTARAAGIKKLVIESGKIRGIDEKQQVVIITTNNVPNLNGKQLGIARLDMLSDRLNLMKNQGTLEIETTDSNFNKTDIGQLDLTAGKVKTQFRSSTIETVKGVPKNVSDVPAWEIKIDSKVLPVITQAVSAMSSEAVTIASKDGKTVSIELVDSIKDIFTTELTEPPIYVGTGAVSKTSFCHKYPSKIFITLLKDALKTADPLHIHLGEGGICWFKINGFDFFILPSQ